jgi:hypothetical protein
MARYPASISTNRPIRIPLDSIPDNLFHKKTRKSDGELYWQLVYDIVLDINNSSISFWVEINGKQFGRILVS